MAPSASRFVTRDEFAPVREGLERLIVRVEILTQDLHQLSLEVGARFEAIDQRFEAIDQRFEAIDQRFEAIDRRFEAIDRRFEAIDRRFDRIEERLGAHDAKFEAIDARFDALEQHVDTGFSELRKLIQDNHAAIVSVLNRYLVPR